MCSPSRWGSLWFSFGSVPFPSGREWSDGDLLSAGNVTLRFIKVGSRGIPCVRLSMVSTRWSLHMWRCVLAA